MEASRANNFRKVITGVGLIGFPLFGVISSVFDAQEDTGMGGAELYRIAAAHHEQIWVAALLFIVSALLTVPALGVLNMVRTRGIVAGYIGGALMLVGAFGHMGFATWQMMLAKIPASGNEVAMAAYLDRSASVTNVLLPMLIAVAIGLVLVGFALYRAGFAPLWVPVALVAVVVVEMALDSVASRWMPVGIWAAALVVFGYLGIRVLRLSAAEWANGEAAPRSENAVAKVATARSAAAR